MELFYYDSNNLKKAVSFTSVLISKTEFDQFNGAQKYVMSECFNAFDGDMFKLNPKEDTQVIGYLQSWVYFQDYETDIRREFTFKENVISRARKLLLRAAQPFSKSRSVETLMFIGVHVRRGDTVEPRQIQYGYVHPPVTYYYKAMDYFLKLSNGKSNVLFVYCSDDINWVRKTMNNVTEKYNMAFMEGNSGVVDLAILSLCNHTIISTGTFGWWAAFLAGGETVYYPYVAREGSGLRSRYSDDLEDFWLPGWISME